MTDALKVKKFADEHIYEFHWNGEHLVVFVSTSHIEELCEFISADILTDSDIECVLKDGYIAIPQFEYIVEFYNLDEDDMNEIFPKED